MKNFFAQDFKKNIVSGFIIFLIALPLSVGISVASGAPPSSGLLSAIIGGCLGSLLGGGAVTINGAAAGLIVVVLDIIQKLGQGDPMLGFRLFLGASIIAGLLQVLMGVFRLGIVGLAVPLQALHGMMTAIGITIVTKQLYVLGGIKPQAKETLLQLFEIPSRLADENLEILGIGLFCLLAVVAVGAMPRVRRWLPPPLAAVILGWGLSRWVDIEHSHFVSVFNHEYPVGPEYLLSVPLNWKDYFITPLFQMPSWSWAVSVFTLAFVATIESQLSTNAVDKLDPLKRRSDLNRDLISKGVCNTFLGFIGGLPIISEIVRSSANVLSGATQKSSNFFHGLFIALFLLLFPQVLNTIPLTTFAAILIYVGFRLAQPAQFVHLFRKNKYDFTVFTFTVVMTLATDLLIGILAGVLLEWAINAWRTRSLWGLIRLQYHKIVTQDHDEICLDGPCVFTNVLVLKKHIDECPHKKITVDIHENYVDPSAAQLLLDIQDDKKRENIELQFKGLNAKKEEH